MCSGELDEEMLSLCEAVLVKNPDIYTLWNIRRATLERLQERNLAGDNNVVEEEKLYHNELGLTEQCIKVSAFEYLFTVLLNGFLEANPKSYSAWFQRSWILKRQRNPDLKKELAMCREGLKMDCRFITTENYCSIPYTLEISTVGIIAES